MTDNIFNILSRVYNGLESLNDYYISNASLRQISVHTGMMEAVARKLCRLVKANSYSIETAISVPTVKNESETPIIMESLEFIEDADKAKDESEEAKSDREKRFMLVMSDIAPNCNYDKYIIVAMSHLMFKKNPDENELSFIGQELYYIFDDIITSYGEDIPSDVFSNRNKLIYYDSHKITIALLVFDYINTLLHNWFKIPITRDAPLCDPLLDALISNQLSTPAIVNIHNMMRYINENYGDMSFEDKIDNGAYINAAFAED